MSIRGLLAVIVLASTSLFFGSPAEADVSHLGVVEVSTPDANELAAAQGRSVAVLKSSGKGLEIEHFVAPSADKAREFAEKIETHRGVVTAEIDSVVTASAYNDTYRGLQYDMNLLNVEGAHATASGLGIKVAILDTGVNAAHEDLSGQVLDGTDFVMDSYTTSSGGTGKVDPQGHGTHVAGTIAAKTNNFLGVASVAPNAKILPVRVLDSAGSGWDSDIADGVIWATDNGAKVINMSLGGPTPSSVSLAAVQYAQSHGVVVIAAAGNSGDTGNPVMYPAGFSETVSVSATDSSDTPQSWSERNSEVDIAAPGASIASTATAGNYEYKSGTSMAAPHVSGVAALLFSYNPNATVTDIRRWLETTANDCGVAGRDDACGNGRVNPVAALNLAISDAATATTTTTTSTSAMPTTTTMVVPTTTTVAPTTTTTVAPTTTTAPPTTAPPTTAPPTTAPPTTAPPTTAPPTTAPPTRPTTGYRTLALDGQVLAFGTSAWFGDATGRIGGEAVSLAATNTNNGYWVTSSRGEVLSFGDAGNFGSMAGKSLNAPIINMAVTPSGQGYWLLAKDGGVFTFGDAGFFGSTGNLKLNQPAVGMTASKTGRGYWFVASDGGIFAFGDAPFLGSMGGTKLNRPVTGMTVSTTGNGYRMVAADGGIFSFGDVAFYGSLGANPPTSPIQAMQPTRSNSGYYMVTQEGSVYGFGDANLYGNARARTRTVAVSY